MPISEAIGTREFDKFRGESKETTQVAVLVENSDVQHPIPTNGDSIYIKDLDIPNCDNGDFTGSITDYFDSLKSVNGDTTANNPKSIKLWFKRTTYSHSIGFGCDDIARGFGTDITIKLLGSGDTVRFERNYSFTDKNSFIAEFGPREFNGVVIEFNTTDEVCLSNLTIPKSSEVSATINGTDPNGFTRQVNVTEDGDLAVTDNSSGLSIAEGKVTNKSFIHKFGDAPNFNIADGFVTIWDGADPLISAEARYVYSEIADIDSLSSTDAADTQEIEVFGQDNDTNPLTQTITLDGQNTVVFPIPMRRVFRMKNIGSVDIAGIVYCYTSGAAVTNGAPDVPNTTRAIINDGNNQTLMGLFTVPAGYTGYMRDWYASASAAKRDSVHQIQLLARPLGQVFQMKHKASISINGTSYIQHAYNEPEVFYEKTDIEIRANTDQADSGVSAGFDIVLVKN